MAHYDYLLKVLLIGDSGVGKTSLLYRMTSDKFDENYVTTIGVDFGIQQFDVNGKIVKMQIWDTAGQERFKAIVTSYYRGSHAIFLVYDVTDIKSFDNIRKWIEEIKQYADENVKLFLIANKVDRENKRVVSQEEGQKYADKLNAVYFETSAKTAYNVEKIFIAMAEYCVNEMPNIYAKKQQRTHIALENRTRNIDQTDSKCPC
jgi:Ras-related protein Rab-1A